jgi:hypothetical protein
VTAQARQNGAADVEWSTPHGVIVLLAGRERWSPLAGALAVSVAQLATILPTYQLDRVDLSAVAALIGESAPPPVTRGARTPHHLQVMPPPYVVIDTRLLTDVIAEQGRSA